MDAKLSVSDHAVLRYLQRHEGVDVEAARRAIADHPELKRLVSVLGGSGRFPVNGFVYIVKDHVVVTVLGG